MAKKEKTRKTQKDELKEAMTVKPKKAAADPVPENKKKKESAKKKEQDLKKLYASVPFTRVYEEMGMAETVVSDTRSRFSTCYAISEVLPENVKNVDTADIRKATTALINAFTDVRVQFIVANTSTSVQNLIDKTKIRTDNANYKKAADVLNDIVAANAEFGHNNMEKWKYVVFSVESDIPENAIPLLEEVEDRARRLFFAICKIRIDRLSIDDRLSLISYMFNFDQAGKQISLKDLGKQTVKALVCPKKMVVEKNHILFNDKKYCRLLFINNFPTILSDSLISELTNVSSTMLYSSIYDPLDTAFGVEIFEKKAKDNISEKVTHKRRSLGGKSTDVIVEKTMKISNEDAYFTQKAYDKLKEASENGLNMFMGSFLIALFADNLDDLDADTKLLTLSATKFAFQIKTMDYNQLPAFQSILPLGNTFVDIKRVFDAGRLSALSPLDTQDVLKQDGLYYGINAINENLILLNRKNATLPSGLITGNRNSGKTWQVKREIFNNLVSTNDDVYLVTVAKRSSVNDPSTETFFEPQAHKYTSFVEQMGGETLTNLKHDIFKRNSDYGAGADSSVAKADFYSALVSALNNFRKTASDREAVAVEEEIKKEALILTQADQGNIVETLRYIKKNRSSFPRTYDTLMNKISLTFIDGKHADVSKRFTEFVVDRPSDILVVLDYVWQRSVVRKKEGVSSWIYIDYVDDLLKIPDGIRFIKALLSMSNKLQNPVTLVIQHSAFFASGVMSYAIPAVCSEMSYFKLLNQGPLERQTYQQLFNLQGSLLPYITNVNVGTGILISQSMTIPFNDNAETCHNDDLAARMTDIFGGGRQSERKEP